MIHISFVSYFATICTIFRPTLALKTPLNIEGVQRSYDYDFITLRLYVLQRLAHRIPLQL